MITMGMVKLSLIEIIEMITVRNHFMGAFLVSAGTRYRATFHRILRVHRDNMLIVVVIVKAMKVSIVQIIEMPIVLNSGMPALLTVDMDMLLMNVVRHHKFSFYRK